MKSNVSNVRSIPLIGVLVVNMLSHIADIIIINQSYISLSKENLNVYYNLCLMGLCLVPSTYASNM